jgi:enamine deaminase RidA (YjgF/YER057c/UK114 family)
MKKQLSQFLQLQFSQWRRYSVIAVCTLLFGVTVFAVSAQAYGKVRPPRTVTFTPGAATSPISAGVAFPKDAAFYFTSGTVPPAVNLEAPANSRDRFGDTYTQAVNTLKRVEELLKSEGLSLKDVAFLICYLVPDPVLGGQVDYQGWFRAYGEFFNNAQNPVKTARSTLGVQGLVNPGWLVEIEAIAVYPRR